MLISKIIIRVSIMHIIMSTTVICAKVQYTEHLINSNGVKLV